MKTVFGHRASKALESLLDEALTHTGERISLEAAPKACMKFVVFNPVAVNDVEEIVSYIRP